MTIGENIRKLREAEGITQQSLADMLGKSPSTIGMYEQDRRTPGYDVLRKVADIFSVSVESLIDGRAKKGRGVKIPVLGFVRAGIPIDAVEEILDYEEITMETAAQGEHFGLAIKGDSMEPRITEGDVVIVRRQDMVNNGDLAVVLVNGCDATVKKFYMNESGVKLISTNPKYDPFFFTPEEVKNLPVQVLGKVVELRAKF